jgi:hypothetical protein
MEFSKILSEKGLAYVLSNVCGLSPTKDRNTIARIIRQAEEVFTTWGGTLVLN